MQRVAGVSWAKPDSNNALFGKDDLGTVPAKDGLRSIIGKIAFLVPGDACRRGTAFGLGACETETLAAKKVAHGNRCSNLPKGFRANTRPGHEAAQSQRREASMRPRDKGSRKTDAVSNSSAIGASSPAE